MSSYFKKELPGLRKFYSSMRSQNQKVGVFAHTYNNVESDVIFDTDDKDPWVLTFLRKGIGNGIKIPVEPGFCFVVKGDQATKEFRDYFEIKSGSGNFQMDDFLSHCSTQVPSSYVLGNGEADDDRRLALYRYDKMDSASEGIYPIGYKHWGLINAKARANGATKDVGHRSKANLKKTQVLWPALYEIIKTDDISVCYSLTPGKYTDMLRQGSLAKEASE